MPDKAVDRGLSQPIADNTAGTANWLDAGRPGQRGDPDDTEEVTGPPGQAHIPGSLSGRSYSRLCATGRRVSPRTRF